jgi:HEPN domain
MIKITRFEALYPDNPFGRPDMQAGLLARTAADYYRTCQMLHQMGRDVIPLFGVLVPALQQTMELLVKSIALRNVPAFDPKAYGHKILGIVDEHAQAVPIFAKLGASEEIRQLLLELTEGYLAVRYGEAHVSYDDDTWKTFCQTAGELIAVAQAPVAEPKEGTV